MRITFAFSASVLPLIVACSAPEPEPAPVPAPQPPKIVAPPAPAPAPQPTGSWTDWPLAEGDWVYRSDQRGSLALFGKPNSDATVLIRCDQDQKRIFISRAGSVGRSATMTLRASSGLQSFPARSTGAATPYAAVSLAPNDYMLDRIAFSRGRFALQVNGLTSLAIPIWPEFTRVVEDCRD